MSQRSTRSSRLKRTPANPPRGRPRTGNRAAREPNVRIGGEASTPSKIEEVGSRVPLPPGENGPDRIDLTMAPRRSLAPKKLAYVPNLGTVADGARPGSYTVKDYGQGLPLTGKAETFISVRSALASAPGINLEAIFQTSKRTKPSIELPSTLKINEEPISVPGRQFEGAYIDPIGTVDKRESQTSRLRFMTTKGSMLFPTGTAVLPRSPRITVGEVSKMEPYTPHTIEDEKLAVLSQIDIEKLVKSGPPSGRNKYNKTELSNFARALGISSVDRGRGTKTDLISAISKVYRELASS